MRASQYMKHFVKQAGTAETVGGAILRGMGGALKLMGKHPFLTMGALGAGALAVPIVRAAKYPYYVINENQKKDIMKQQSALLSSIAAGQHQKPVSEPKLITVPLI